MNEDKENTKLLKTLHERVGWFNLEASSIEGEHAILVVGSRLDVVETRARLHYLSSDQGERDRQHLYAFGHLHSSDGGIIDMFINQYDVGGEQNSHFDEKHPDKESIKVPLSAIKKIVDIPQAEFKEISETMEKITPYAANSMGINNNMTRSVVGVTKPQYNKDLNFNEVNEFILEVKHPKASTERLEDLAKGAVSLINSQDKELEGKDNRRLEARHIQDNKFGLKFLKIPSNKTPSILYSAAMAIAIGGHEKGSIKDAAFAKAGLALHVNPSYCPSDKELDKQASNLSKLNKPSKDSGELSI